LWFGLSAAALLVGCAYTILFCASTRDISAHAQGTDDAYISYLYAKNLVSGHGLVFNPGEHVEGYSNPLYVLLMTIPFLVGGDVFAFSMTLNALCALATLAILIHHLRWQLGDHVAVLGAVLFALSPSIWTWVSSGLETPLILLLQVSIWVLVEHVVQARSKRALPLLCFTIVLLVLARADGFVMPVFAVGYLALKRNWRAAAGCAAFLVVTLGLLFAWRLNYYQDLWPNTYYAKVTSSLALRLKSAVRELGGIMARQGLVFYLASIAACAGLLLRELRARGLVAVREASFGLVFSVSWLSYWLYVGGDNFEDRFLIVLIPIGIYLLFGVALKGARPATLYFVVATCALVQLSVLVREDQFSKTFGKKYDRWITLGRFLAVNRPGRVLATGAAGKIPYFSGLKTIDMLGLNDRYIGHLPARRFVAGHCKYDENYVLRRAPELIFGRFEGDGLDFDLGLSREKYEQAGYRVRFLLNTQRQSQGASDVIDVAGWTDQQIIIKAARGFNEAIAERATVATAALAR
jgi:hypothetical protein